MPTVPVSICSASSCFSLLSQNSFLLFNSLFHFDRCSLSILKNKRCSPSPKRYHFVAAFPSTPHAPRFSCRGGSTSVRRRLGDERDGITPIPALPLSRSNSPTKLSGSISASTARVNLLCHLQSARGRALSCVRTLRRRPSPEASLCTFSPS